MYAFEVFYVIHFKVLQGWNRVVVVVIKVTIALALKQTPGGFEPSLRFTSVELISIYGVFDYANEP
jgi:hypothetical protein